MENNKLIENLGKRYSNYGIMIALVSTIHLAWGIIILTYGHIPPTNTLFPLSKLFVFPFGAISLILSSCLAIYSLKKSSIYSSFLVLPQQFFLLLSTVGVITAIVTSSFADGVVRDWQFIASDQIVWLVLIVFYTYNIITRNAIYK